MYTKCTVKLSGQEPPVGEAIVHHGGQKLLDGATVHIFSNLSVKEVLQIVNFALVPN